MRFVHFSEGVEVVVNFGLGGDGEIDAEGAAGFWCRGGRIPLLIFFFLSVRLSVILHIFECGCVTPWFDV